MSLSWVSLLEQQHCTHIYRESLKKKRKLKPRFRTYFVRFQDINIRSEGVRLEENYIFYQILVPYRLSTVPRAYTQKSTGHVSFFKRLLAPATLFVYFLYFFLQYINSYTHSCFLIAFRSVQGLPGVPSRIRTRASPTASRRTTI